MKRWQKFTENEIKDIFNESENVKDFLIKLGYTGNSNNAYIDIRKEYPWISFSRKINLLNQKFGKLTVIKEIEEERMNGRHVKWLCKCSCGKELIIESSHLINGKRTQCQDCSKKQQQLDLIGQKFGLITIIEKDIKRSKIKRRSYFFGKCDCGSKVKSYSAHSLINGDVISCGCFAASKGEIIIKNILDELNLKYIQQFSFSDCVGEKLPLKFDFYLPENNILIEYQGEQHFQPIKYFGGEDKFLKQQKYDQIKRDYCKNKKIKLIEISYKEKCDKRFLDFLLKEEHNENQRTY